VRGSARVWYPPYLVMVERTILADGVNCYNMAPIHIKSGAVVSQRAHLCAGAHNIDDKNFQLQAKAIVVGSNCWIAAEAFVGPGVNIGDGAVLGAPP
jgi:putative colanic acid biosynthesis acetyltransferase WcaF